MVLCKLCDVLLEVFSSKLILNEGNIVRKFEGELLEYTALAFRQFVYFFGLPGSDLDETWWKWIPPLPCSFLNFAWEEIVGKIDENHGKSSKKRKKNWPPKGL